MMDLFFKDKEEALLFKNEIMIGMLNGSYKWENGIVMRDAIDHYVANGGDFEKILKDKFGVVFDEPDAGNICESLAKPAGDECQGQSKVV